MAIIDCALLPNRVGGTKRVPVPYFVPPAFKNIVMECKPTCPVCGEKILHEHHVGHQISVFHNGPSVCYNLVAVHRYCNIGTDDIKHLVDKYDPKEILVIKYEP